MYHTLEQLPGSFPEAKGATMPQFCQVTSDNGLNIRTEPHTQAPIVANDPKGTTLNFVEIVNGEMIEGNPHWGHSEQGHYYWMGGTDHPNR